METTKNATNQSDEIEEIAAEDKTWLQKLKQESWEAELLISAVGIFGSFQLFGFIDWLANLFIDLLPSSLYIVCYFIVYSGLIAVSVLACMFVIHFMLRAYWVGLVGLNSVFSDYSTKDSFYSESYTKKIIAVLPKLDHSVEQADKLCSVIFSAAFGVLIMYSTLGLFGTLYLLIFNLLTPYIPYYLLLIPIVAMGLLLIVQSIYSIISNIPRFKQNEAIQHHYFRLIIVGSKFMFGPMYKQVLQISMIFSSNFKQDSSLVKLVLVFVLCGFFVTGAKISDTNVMYLFVPEKYFDENEADPRFYQDSSSTASFLLAPQLPSDVVKEPLINIFIPVFKHEKRLFEEPCKSIFDLEDATFVEERAAYLTCYKHYHQIVINGIELEADIIKATHPVTGQFGIYAYVYLDERFSSGVYQLEVNKHFEEGTHTFKVPFYYQSPFN